MTERRTPGAGYAYEKGFRLDESTGKPTQEYSHYMEVAQQLTEELMALRREIAAAGKKIVPGREALDASTINELQEDVKFCEEMVSDFSTNAAQKEKFQAAMAKLQREIQEAETLLGIPNLERRAQDLSRQVEFLISHDRMADTSLRNMPPEGFADKDV